MSNVANGGGGGGAFGGGGSGSRGSGTTIKVDPAVMEAKANSVNAKSTALRQRYSELLSSVMRSRSYWQGEASEVTRASLSDTQKLADEMCQRLESHSRNLISIAQVYTNTQTALTSVSSALPKDAIE